MSFEEIRAASHDLARNRRKAIVEYQLHAEAAANAERDFRKKLATELTKFRSAEKGVGESEILANAEAADQRHARDLAHSIARADLLRIDAYEREQATLRQLADFSKDLETVG